MSKKRFYETGQNYDQKFVCPDNLGQNIWNKADNIVKLDRTRKL